MSTEYDVAVIGAGPAGLSCTATLADGTDLRIALVDSGHEMGGQYWRRPASGAPADPGLYHDLATYDRLRKVATNRATWLPEHHVWAAVADGDGFEVHALDRGAGPGGEREVTLRARTVALATGAFDRALPFPGWDLPGVMTIGGVQALLKSGGVAAGRRVALGGTGPFLLPVAAALAARGSTVIGIHEASSPARWLRHAAIVTRNPGKLSELASYAATLARHRVPVRPRSMIVEAHGDRRVEAVTVARLDAAGRLRPGRETMNVDAVGVGWGFTPQLDLAVTLACGITADASGAAVVEVDDLQRTSRPGVYAAGEPCGVGGAALALIEGRLAAAGIAAELDPAAVPDPRSDLRAARRLRRFAAAMHQAHPVPAAWAETLRPSTVLCRCEEVSCGEVSAAVDAGADSARQVKQLTRAGMGWCQGRVCGFAAGLLAGEAPGLPTERLVAAPVPLGMLGSADL